MSDKILIVDDEPNLLRMLSYALYADGYSTLTADSGEAALAAVAEERPDLVILDVMMPGMDGLEVCARLRNQPATSDLPIIMLSARTQVPERIEGLRAGADEYVTKPVSPKELTARVAALLERTRRLRQAEKRKRGRVIGFIGAKGGVGTTTVAVNTALMLVQQGATVAAVELRPDYGTLASHLGRIAHGNMERLLVCEPEEIDAAKLEAHLVRHISGLRVLFGPEPGEIYDLLNFERAKAIIKGMAGMVTYTILDLPPAATVITRAALRQCDDVVLVLEPDPVSIEAAQSQLRLLEEWGVDKSAIGVVLVSRNKMGLTPATVSARLGCWVLATVPPAPALFYEAMKHDAAVVAYEPESEQAAAFGQLAAFFLPDAEGAEAAEVEKAAAV